MMVMLAAAAGATLMATRAYDPAHFDRFQCDFALSWLVSFVCGVRLMGALNEHEVVLLLLVRVRLQLELLTE